jgi:GNAT superfamily N-acetyltransferase
MTQLAVAIHEVSRAAMQRWLPLLDAWLLAGSIYSVQHTWPQLYRSDGGGRFFVATDGDRLLSHCAFRTVRLHGERSTTPIHLLGSVATDPDLRGQGLASAVLASALAAATPPPATRCCGPNALSSTRAPASRPAAPNAASRCCAARAARSPATCDRRRSPTTRRCTRCTKRNRCGSNVRPRRCRAC